ncbi:hypothetical protein B0H14DRAFT_2639431 [Mycena olivaceomarginata]|nr:hypothetical protein B0H14DRAFT_2639431 [Mycena olivaceomarginata]
MPISRKQTSNDGTELTTAEKKRIAAAKHYRKKIQMAEKRQVTGIWWAPIVPTNSARHPRAQKREKKSKSRKRKGKTSPKDIEADHKNEALCDGDTSEETAQIDSTLAQAERAAATLAEAEQDASEALSEMWRRVQPAAPTREAPDGNTTAPDLFQDWSCPTGMLRTWKEGPILRRKAKQACEKEDDHFQEYIRGGRLLRSRVSRFPATMGKFHMAVQAVPSCTPASPRTGEGPDGTREGSIAFDDDQSEPDDQHKYGPQPPVLLSNCFQAITIMRVGLQTHKVVRRMVIQRKGEFRPGMACSFPKTRALAPTTIPHWVVI